MQWRSGARQHLEASQPGHGSTRHLRYVGAEVAIGSFLVNYMHEPDIGNLNLETAAKYLTGLLGRRHGRPLHRLLVLQSDSAARCARI